MQYVLDEHRIRDPIAFVEGLFAMQDKITTILHSSFDNDPALALAIETGFREFADGNKQRRLPEMLSYFANQIFTKEKSSPLAVSDSRVVSEKMLFQFRCLQDKDRFETYYRFHLAKRLLSFQYHQSTEQQDIESQLISNLRHECGPEYTSKLEAMFKDVRLSEECMERFRQYRSYRDLSSSTDIHVKVITKSVWPASWPHRVILPEWMSDCCSAYATFYNDIHTGRKLEWQLQLGQGVAKARFPKSKYELYLSTLQIVILNLFNDRDSYTFDELQRGTNIPKNELQRSLIPLCSDGTAILLQSPLTIGPLIRDSDVFTWNNRFKSANSSVRVATGMIKDVGLEEQGNIEHKIHQERNPEMEAAIVRIMKSRKQLHFSQLCEETILQLRHRFMPTVQEIKARIEKLIEREFISRDVSSRQLYHYVA